jgi:hypothetical protein
MFILPPVVTSYNALISFISTYFGKELVLYYKEEGGAYFIRILDEIDFQELFKNDYRYLFIGVESKKTLIETQSAPEVGVKRASTALISEKVSPPLGAAIKFQFCCKCEKILTGGYSKLKCGHQCHTPCAHNPNIKCVYCAPINAPIQ